MITKPAEHDRAKFSNSTMSASLKWKASVHPRKTNNAELEIIGDPLQLVNSRDHATLIAATFHLRKTETTRRYASGFSDPRLEYPKVDLDDTTEWVQWTNFQCMTSTYVLVASRQTKSAYANAT